MDGAILKRIFQKLDKLNIYTKDRNKGIIPFVLLDGHQSRFDIDFLTYINDDDHKWNVCLGVPYGTALWQVADSSQQNGTYKMLMNEIKKELFRQRLNVFQSSLGLMRTDIIPIVNWCWPKAFANVEHNLHAIHERGWNPLSRALLLVDVIRATITEDILKWEKNCGLFSESQIKKYHSNLSYVNDQMGEVTIQRNHHLKMDNGVDLNFKHNTAQYVMDTIISEVDKQEARERIQKAKREGTTLKERLSKISKKLTAGKMVLDLQMYRLDESILYCIKKSAEKKKEQNDSKIRREALQYMKLCFKADEVLKKNVNKDVDQWSSKADIKTVLGPLKHKDDPKMPSDRAELIKRYQSQNSRNRRSVSSDVHVLESFRVWKEEQIMLKKKGKDK